jgi:plasmid stability protein
MADLLVRGIGSELERLIKESARRNNRSLSAEAKALLQQGLASPDPPEKLGTFLFSLLDDEDRGDDLIFVRNDLFSPPPTFE